MSDNEPDKWIVVRITRKDCPVIHKVFASWYVDILVQILGN